MTTNCNNNFYLFYLLLTVEFWNLLQLEKVSFSKLIFFFVKLSVPKLVIYQRTQKTSKEQVTSELD